MKNNIFKVLGKFKLYRAIRSFYHNPRITLEEYYSKIHDKYTGLDTVNRIHENDLGIPLHLMPNRYEGSGNSYMKRVLLDLNITNNDIIIDYGCGKGRALLYFSKFPFKKIIGIEYSHSVFLVAQENIKKIKDPRILILHKDAGDFQDLDDINFFYFFNPFGEVTFNRVLDNLSQSHQNRPRLMYVIYLNPECHKDIEARGLFEKYAEYDSGYPYKYYIYKSVC